MRSDISEHSDIDLDVESTLPVFGSFATTGYNCDDMESVPDSDEDDGFMMCQKV